MFANLQAKRKLEEALSAQDDVTPGKSRPSCRMLVTFVLYLCPTY